MTTWFRKAAQFLTMYGRIMKAERTQKLDLSGFGLIKVPDFVSQSSHLKELDLSHNQLAALPEAIDKLTQLKRLNLSYNQFKTLPESLLALPALQELSLHGNNALNLPDDVINLTADQILNAYFGAPLGDAQVFAVGFTGVGKTSLIDRLVNDRVDPNVTTTPGLQLSQWPLALREAEAPLQVWDFSGVEEMHAIHQLFLTPRSLYLVVLASRFDLEDIDAEYWLEMIQGSGGDAPIIVVLNKISEHSFDINRTGLQQKYPNIKAFVETDAVDGKGIDALRQQLASACEQLPQRHQQFPKSWLTVKDHVAAALKQQHHISLDDYRQLCETHRVAGRDKQDELAAWLYDIGTALIFINHGWLPDTHVLDPPWFARGVYAILTSKLLSERQGRLHRADLATILDATDYPPDQHAFFADMLCRFELCFPLPEAEDGYIFPTMLDIQQPNDVDMLDRDNGLVFQYRYPVMPLGLLSRFIGRTRERSHDQPRWRTGVMLKQDQVRALVRADASERRIEVVVDGTRDERATLVGRIRAEMDDLHRAFGIQPQTLIALPGYPNEYVSLQELLAYKQHGLERIEKFVDDELLELDVQEILTEIEPDQTTSR